MQQWERMCVCTCVCVRVFKHLCAFLPVHELVFVHVRSLITTDRECRECSDPTSCPTCPTHSRGTLMGSGGGSDSSVTLTRACRPLLQSGIAHPQCQNGEFIFLAPAFPSAGNRGPPSVGSLSPSALSLFSPSQREIYWGGGQKQKKISCDLHLTRSKHMAVVV